jgi:CheY-like chemotaxis protein
MEAGQVELDPQAFSPIALLDQTLDLVAEQAQSKALRLGVAPQRDLEPIPPFVMADAARLRQVLLNLLVNAIKFTRVGEISVALSYDPGLGHLRFAVTDTGDGVPDALRHRLFQRFSQVDSSTTRRYGGTGLGLAICKHLVELMGGDIGVDSREGEGSTFWFTVLAPPAEAPGEVGRDQAYEAQAEPARILVVDDVPNNRELVRAMLEAMGHQVEDASGGAEAVEIAGRIDFDLIFMDMQMPGMDGLAATRKVRATSRLNAHTPIVALTANVLSSQIAACIEAGMDDHLAKPINPRELLEKVALWATSRPPASANGTCSA